MKRFFVVLLAVAALVAAGWFGVRALGGDHPLASVAIPFKAAENLPDTPGEWHGRIDYRTLDAQLAALAQRPEMAGLAVAVIEDGKLTFVRTYGVADAATGAPVTPHTLFRWASVSKPLTAIARHYLETSNCPRFMPQDIMRERKQRLADLAKEYKADGIIVASNKFCEYWSYERTIDTIVMPRDFGYPVCSIEKEYINGASGQLRTRFQAFVESIEIKKIQEGK